MFQTTNQSFSLWHFFLEMGWGSQTWVSKKVGHSTWPTLVIPGDSQDYLQGKLLESLDFQLFYGIVPGQLTCAWKKLCSLNDPQNGLNDHPEIWGGLFWWGGMSCDPGNGISMDLKLLKVWTEFHGFSAPWNGLSQSKIDLQFQRCYNDFFSTVDWLCIYSCHV